MLVGQSQDLLSRAKLYIAETTLCVHMLACHSLTGAGRRCKTTWLDTKDRLLLAAIVLSRVEVFFVGFLSVPPGNAKDCV